MSCRSQDEKIDGYGSYVLLLLLLSFLLSPFPQTACADEHPTSLEQLLDDLKHAAPEHRWDAIGALGALGDKRAVPPLIVALKKDMQERKGYAMGIIPVLGQLGDERAVPILMEALSKQDESWLGREAAARALGDIGSPEATTVLIRSAWQAETRAAAIEALAAIGDPRGIDVLISAFSEPEEPEVREAAVAGLVNIGERAVPALINKLETHNQEYPENNERALAAWILGKIGDPRAVPPLTKALDDASADVQKNARAALEQLTDPRQ